VERLDPRLVGFERFPGCGRPVWRDDLDPRSQFLRDLVSTVANAAERSA
jgi:hypothetical protein